MSCRLFLMRREVRYQICNRILKLLGSESSRCHSGSPAHGCSGFTGIKGVIHIVSHIACLLPHTKIGILLWHGANDTTDQTLERPIADQRILIGIGSTLTTETMTIGTLVGVDDPTYLESFFIYCLYCLSSLGTEPA